MFCAKAYAALLLLVASGFARGAAYVPAEVADQTGVVSSLRRGDVVFVSTSQGIYTASVTEKVWHKLDVPAEMRPGGIFIQQSAAAQVIAYYHPWKLYMAITDLPATPAMPSELFISKDGGKTWRQTSKDGRLTSVYIHPSGVFLSTQETAQPPAHVNKPADIYFPQTSGVFISQDFGATWKDVTNNLPAKIIFNQFVRDPVHPDKIAVTGYDPTITDELKSRGPDIYEADPGVYQWKPVYADFLQEFTGTLDERKSPWQYGKGEQYGVVVGPTLANFFTPAFVDREAGIGSSPWLPPVLAFQLETEKTVYTFRKDEPKIIPVTVAFLASHPKAKLLDKKDESALWHIGMVSYGKERGFDPQTVRFGIVAPGRKESRDAVRRDPDLITVALDPAHPYKRDIDLAKLHDFSKPGVYRFQLYHDDSALADWGGYFGTPVIDVTITE